MLCSVLELDNNEAAVSLCIVRFTSWSGEAPMLAVGTAQGLSFYPRQVEGVSPFLHTRTCTNIEMLSSSSHSKRNCRDRKVPLEKAGGEACYHADSECV